MAYTARENASFFTNNVDIIIRDVTGKQVIICRRTASLIINQEVDFQVIGPNGLVGSIKHKVVDVLTQTSKPNFQVFDETGREMLTCKGDMEEGRFVLLEHNWMVKGQVLRPQNKRHSQNIFELTFPLEANLGLKATLLGLVFSIKCACDRFREMEERSNKSNYF